MGCSRPGPAGTIPRLYANPADWIDNVEHTDQDGVSYGCGSLFLNYLAYQLNFTWPAIYRAGAPSTNTLAETAQIVGASGGYAAFLSLLQTSFPTGNLYASTTPVDERLDDVYPLGPPAGAAAGPLHAQQRVRHRDQSWRRPRRQPRHHHEEREVANPQQTYSTPQSTANADESDAAVIAGQPTISTSGLERRPGGGAERICHRLFLAACDAGDAVDVDPDRDELLSHGSDRQSGAGDVDRHSLARRPNSGPRPLLLRRDGRLQLPARAEPGGSSAISRRSRTTRTSSRTPSTSPGEISTLSRCP